MISLHGIVVYKEIPEITEIVFWNVLSLRITQEFTKYIFIHCWIVDNKIYTNYCILFGVLLENFNIIITNQKNVIMFIE